ncbi:YtxH domain-containing protein [Sporosarcina limicola]|uniref:Epoxyqueuosine reductase QueG n=1 Tax=Sporosarcina limicola TaxID=34101 RepID=A0A927R5C5_9BACL|nr:YtxH domain-containing protein [Sporosarcina limicola]MBE1555873.1 epoxyqueuosine reductase QueG [Sporosarcina limicola]
MGKSKIGKFIFFGALLGATVSMFDRSTREQVAEKSKSVVTGISFYSKNPGLVKRKVQEKGEKIQAIYVQVSENISYIKEQIEELKTLTPQVKELVVNTKDAFVESKDDYKSIMNEAPVPEGPNSEK